MDNETLRCLLDMLREQEKVLKRIERRRTVFELRREVLQRIVKDEAAYDGHENIAVSNTVEATLDEEEADIRDGLQALRADYRQDYEKREAEKTVAKAKIAVMRKMLEAEDLLKDLECYEREELLRGSCRNS